MQVISDKHFSCISLSVLTEVCPKLYKFSGDYLTIGSIRKELVLSHDNSHVSLHAYDFSGIITFFLSLKFAFYYVLSFYYKH